MSDNDDRDSLKILVATDNHLGVWEKDEIRKHDSFVTFEEILQIAQQQAVDLVLLAGDLFHDNKPSRSTIVRAIDILTQYTLSDKPVAFQVVSDQSANFVSRRVNFENSNFNVGLPVFTIHGNHDDPAGADNLSAVDVLSTCNLVNYFGKAALCGSGVGKIRIEPVLLKKGNTKVGIYGLGNVRDERLGRMFQTPGCVEWARPAGSPDCPQNEWFNVFVLHQNRVPHSQNAKNCIRESYLARFLDFVIWGHEHECIQESWEHATSEDKSFSLIQPGSSVATALSEGESKKKHVVLFEINRERYRTVNFPLESVRPFIHDNVTLQDHVEVAGEDSEAITAFLENKVEYMIQKANSRAVGGRDTMLPLIRLRVDYTGFSTINAQRFGQKFVGKVANPHDILLWHKAPVRKAKAPGEVSENASLTEGIRPEALDERQIEDLIAEHLQQHLEILPEQDLANALHNFVDKDEKQALHDCVRAALAETQTAAAADQEAGATGPEGDVDAAVNAQIQHRRNQQSAQATTASAARILPSGPSDSALPPPNGTAAMDEDDDMGVLGSSSSRPASAGQGRAGSRPPTAPESARGRQATLGEAFGRSGRSTQQGESSTRTARSPAPRGRRGRVAATPAATPTSRRGATRQTAQQATARRQQRASSEDLQALTDLSCSRQNQRTVVMGAGGAYEVSPVNKRMAQLTGRKDFRRNNPMTDKFKMHRFHHIEYWCPDATNAFKRFSWGLGMPLVAKSDHSTGNSSFASYVLKSNELTFIFTAPYSRQAAPADSAPAVPSYKQDDIYAFVNKHGLAVRAVGISVEDAKQAFEVAVQNGGKPVHPPSVLKSSDGQESVMAEVHMYGDVVMRFMSGTFKGPFLPTYESQQDDLQPSYGLHRLDHAVGNAPKMGPVLQYLAQMTGWHEFAEFTAEDVGTLDSGLNSKVLANDNEMVICPVNEPTFGTPRKSQIQTYLEQNEGAGLQHLAIKTHDIFTTMRQLRARSHQAGFDFMPRASDAYYRKLPAKFGDLLSEDQLKEIEELGLLADLDDQGILLQVFTKPVGDRPTLFLEIIQRIGCEYSVQQPDGEEVMEQAGGCGGFGKGNFSELFKSIEDYERTLKI